MVKRYSLDTMKALMERQNPLSVSYTHLEKSVFGQDPFEPVKMSYIPDIIAQQTSLKCACVKPVSYTHLIIEIDQCEK